MCGCRLTREIVNPHPDGGGFTELATSLNRTKLFNRIAHGAIVDALRIGLLPAEPLCKYGKYMMSQTVKGV